MIESEFFQKLKNFETSSWAVWNEDDCNSLEFFLSKQELFHSRVIFVGLNRSNVANDSSKVSPLSNFHTKGHVGDKRLKRFIQQANLSNLIGGFMTDISNQIETNWVMSAKQEATRQIRLEKLIMQSEKEMRI